MEATVTLKATTAELDVLRDALRTAIDVHKAQAADTSRQFHPNVRSAARTKATQAQAVLDGLGGQQ